MVLLLMSSSCSLAERPRQIETKAFISVEERSFGLTISLFVAGLSFVTGELGKSRRSKHEHLAGELLSHFRFAEFEVTLFDVTSPIVLLKL